MVSIGPHEPLLDLNMMQSDLNSNSRYSPSLTFGLRIGLPYAVRQAGFVSGIILLVVLCGVTDWTIRLIVINAKLAGRNSYIEIMNHCFGSSGRAAVSFFQFTFAFGGKSARFPREKLLPDFIFEGMYFK